MTSANRAAPTWAQKLTQAQKPSHRPLAPAWPSWAVAPAQPGTEGPANGSGFGSQLLEMTIEGQLQGQFETSRSEAGLSHRISIPLPQLAR